MKLKNSVVVVTGASAGVGRAVAREFARHGAKIGLIARGRDGLEAAQKEVRSLGGDALVLVADVANAERVEACSEAVERHFGPIDIWVNNAMVSVFSPVRQMTPEDYRRVTEVTYLGYVYGTLAALKRMCARDRGVIVQVGSALAYRSIPLQSAYCAAKHAIVGFTESLRCELLHDRLKVRVSMVHLPAVNTPQFGWVKSRLKYKAQPVPPIYQPEVPARAIVWMARRELREILVGYSTREAILAEKIAPALADRYLASKGYSAQQTDEPADSNRPNNLWNALVGDYGAHGAFDNRAHEFSFQLWFLMNRRKIVLGALALALLSAKIVQGRGTKRVGSWDVLSRLEPAAA